VEADQNVMAALTLPRIDGEGLRRPARSYPQDAEEQARKARDGVRLPRRHPGALRRKAPTLKTWDEHAMQLAATRKALDIPAAECAIVYVSRTVPGLCRIIRVDEPELEQGWSMFCALLDYWQAKNNYFPQAWKAAA
jgi:hypothetical protein